MARTRAATFEQQRDAMLAAAARLFAARGYPAASIADLAKEFGLTQAQALEVSDHCPVWAEFSAYEGVAVRSIAARPGTGAR